MDSVAKCSLCTESGTCENRIVNCNGCGLNVHILCYGIKNDDLNLPNWKCSPCQRGISEPIVCELCQQLNGAFKQSVCGKWVHVICALFTDGVRFNDAVQMEPIDITKLMNLKCQKTCVFCLKATGVCCLCSKSRCKNPIHITCAHDNNCLQVCTNEKTDSIKFRAFCTDHKPKDSVHHISSQNIQKMLIKKTKKDREKMLHAQNSIMQMDCVGKSAAENMAFEIETTAPGESKLRKVAQQLMKQKRMTDEMASTSNSFSQFDAIDGKECFAVIRKIVVSKFMSDLIKYVI